MAGAVSFIRDADWLTHARVRGYAVLIGVASLGLLVASYIAAMGPTGSDFLAFWGAAKAVWVGDPAGAYDLSLQENLQTPVTGENWFAFVNPPPFLFAVAPFGAMPFPLAWIAWVVVTWSLWAWAATAMFPRLWLLVVTFPGALIAATHAQSGLLIGALLIAAVHWLDRRGAWSGVAIGALIVKPHFAVLLPFWLAAGRRWRAFAWAGLSVAGLLLASWTVFGTDTMLAYPDAWQASRALLAEPRVDFQLRQTSFYAQARMFLSEGAALAVAALSFVLALAAALAAWRRFGDDVRGSAALLLAATALATPYAFSYDLAFLIVPILYCVERGLADGFRPYEKLVLVALWFAPYATRAAALPLGLNLMPFCALILMWLVWSRRPRTGLSTV